ncbi:phospholipase ABHD3-like [Copidosoma floridanum]|uniref:phospholipase ABHD3-like n=1 Tax=Copidosoma floridanum TaxID=29053 RepID=UPI0006C97B2E|nr:phospholipase ABHD3-like [Copidosoma floridanum]
MILDMLESALCIPKLYYGALFGLGFCVYYLFEVVKTPRLYCASNCEDLNEVIEHVHRLHPNMPIAATGISMGGLILGNYLIQKGRAAIGKLKAGLAISVPWNVFEATKSIEKPYLNLMLNWHLCDSLRKNVTRHMDDEIREQLGKGLDIETALKSTTVREFDEYFTARHFGYKDVQDYYSTATLHDKLHRVEVPLLCLSAADDPFQPLEGNPEDFCSKKKNFYHRLSKSCQNLTLGLNIHCRKPNRRSDTFKR